MAVIKLHLLNHDGTDTKRKHTVPNAAVGRSLEANRQVLEGGDSPGSETDAQVWSRLTQEFIDRLLAQGHARHKAEAAESALSGVVKEDAPGEDDV